MSQMMKEEPSMGSEIVITRVFDAPRELVWKAWTEPERFRRWWGPRGYTSPRASIDPRVGGTYLVSMRPAKGQEVWITGTYKEVIEPERLVMSDLFADAMGNVVPASYYKMPGEYPPELKISVSFKEEEGRTRMTLRHSGMPWKRPRTPRPAGTNHSTSWSNDIHNEIFVQMKTLVLVEPGKQAATTIRVQDAPRDMVFKVQTDPELFPSSGGRKGTPPGWRGWRSGREARGGSSRPTLKATSSPSTASTTR